MDYFQKFVPLSPGPIPLKADIIPSYVSVLDALKLPENTILGKICIYVSLKTGEIHFGNTILYYYIFGSLSALPHNIECTQSTYLKVEQRTDNRFLTEQFNAFYLTLTFMFYFLRMVVMIYIRCCIIIYKYKSWAFIYLY